jgi:endonuclease/exonuclease/phosphatase family metal-dependent hydrolase
MVGVPVRGVAAILAGIAASLALSVAATADGQVPATDRVGRVAPIRVLTYNVRFPAATEDPVLEWSNREPAIVRLVLGRDADIVGLQEVKRTEQDAAPEEIVRDLTTGGTGYRVAQPSQFQSSSPTYTGWRSSPKLIVYRAARFRLVASGARPLPNPFDPGDPCFPNAAGRSLTWALLRDKQPPRGSRPTYLVVNTHLTVGRPCWRGRNAQARAVGETVARIQRHRHRTFPQVLVGDLNTDPRAAPKQDHAVAMMTDHAGSLQLRSGGPTSGTHLRGWPDPDAKPGQRIDYVLLSRSLRPLAAGVDDGHHGLPITPSDHLGAWARFAPARG